MIAFLSFLGILLGVASLVIVTSVMNGFRQELIKQLIGMRGNAIARHYKGKDMKNYEKTTNLLSEHPKVKLALPLIEQPTALAQENRYQPTIVYGHDISRLKQHKFLSNKITDGTMDNLNEQDTVMIGKRLAEKFDLGIGDTVTLISQNAQDSMLDVIVNYRDFKIVAIFELGMRQHDTNFIFTSLANAQDFFNYENSITNIEIFTRGQEHIGKELQKYLFDNNIKSIQTLDLYESDSSLYKALNIEKNVMFVILTLMVIIASLNIISGLIMLVKDKNQDIAILRTLGISRATIIKIFFINGAAIGVLGTIGGVSLGLLFTWNIEAIRGLIERLLGTTLFSPEVYYISSLPVAVNINDILMICGISLSLSLLATLYPAIKASRLNPVQILRAAS